MVFLIFCGSWRFFMVFGAFAGFGWVLVFFVEVFSVVLWLSIVIGL